MTATEVYEVVEDLLGGAKSTAHGIEWGPFRIERGSGIAGHGDVWAITAPGHPIFVPIIGLRTRTQLREAMLDLVRQYVPWGADYADAIGRRPR